MNLGNHHLYTLSRLIGAVGTVSPFSAFWTKLAHGFTASVVDGDSCDIGYDSSRGVGIHIEGLSKAFNGNLVLKEIDLDIKPGETFSLIGPSGTGKSVLLKHIVKLEKPDAGRILIDGFDIHSEATPPRKYRYSMVFQSSALFNSLTVARTWACGCARNGSAANGASARSSWKSWLWSVSRARRSCVPRSSPADAQASGHCPISRP